MKHEVTWRALSVSVGGALLGVSLAFGIPGIVEHPPWIIVYVLLGMLGAYVTIPIEPYGYLSLSPVVFLAVSFASGPWQGIIVAALTPALAVAKSLRSRPSKIAEAIGIGGETALALVLATIITELALPIGGQLARFILVTTLTLSMIILLQIARVSVLEGASVRRLLAPMLRSSGPHLLFTAAGSVLVWVMFTLLGAIGVVLAGVVVVEVYYPWRLLGEQRELFLKSLQMISNAVDLKDPYTAHHSRRVSRYATMMARVLNAPESEVERIRVGALMHDIGKIGVPGGLIRKPSRLTEVEMALMKSHVDAGASIVEELQILDRSVDIVRHHHENFDGTGYPSGVAGDRIPLGARIVFVADAFDALTTDRPYRAGRSSAEAVRILEANAHTQFDPKAVEALKKVLTLTSDLSRT